IGRITDGLERIAKALEPSPLTRPVAKELFALKLTGAAAEVRLIEKNLDGASGPALQEMSARFQEGSEVAGKGLEQLAESMHNAAGLMRQRDVGPAKEALEQVAREFERLQRVLESQLLRNEANDQLAAVQDSVDGVPGEVADGQGQGEIDSRDAGQGQ